MPGDFYVREKYVPTWRRRAKPIDRVLRFLSNATKWVLLALCILCVAFVAWPPETSYNEPISFQIARGNTLAWGIIFTLGALLLASIPMLVYRRRVASVAICIAGIAGLLQICRTNPYSAGHLFTFIWTCLALIGWLLSLGLLEADFVLLGAAAGAGMGMFLCAASMGLGERLVILSALFGIRGLFWGHLLEE